LLAFFITFREERTSVERVFDALWHDKEGSGRTAFHTALSRLRKALRAGKRKLKYILVETGEYWLDSARFSVDVDDYDLAIAKARATDGETAEQWYEHAIQLYQGEYLDNLYYDWVFPERRRLTQSYLTVLCALAEIRTQQARHDEALSLLKKALATDPLLEDVHCQIMQVYADQKNQSAIIRQYQEMEQVLEKELGVEPMDSTIEAYKKLIKSIN
jgi:two-component SAPR family response regulator